MKSIGTLLLLSVMLALPVVASPEGPRGDKVTVTYRTSDGKNVVVTLGVESFKS